jgi:hypothetical protein
MAFICWLSICVLTEVNQAAELDIVPHNTKCGICIPIFTFCVPSCHTGPWASSLTCCCDQKSRNTVTKTLQVLNDKQNHYHKLLAGAQSEVRREPSFIAFTSSTKHPAQHTKTPSKNDKHLISIQALPLPILTSIQKSCTGL